MTEDPEYIDEEPEEETPLLPWITGIDVFSKFGKTSSELKQLVKARKVRLKKEGGKELFSTQDLEALLDAETSQSDVSMADLVRATRDLLRQGQQHHETMFDKYMASNDKLFETLTGAVEKQNKHILDLEKQALEMRDATEKVFTLEHERKLGEMREERTRTMQGKALEMVQKTVLPWVAAKVGGMPMPSMIPPSESNGEPATDPRLSQLGQVMVATVATMSDEQFATLGTIIGEGEFAVLTAIREGAKGNET